MWKKIFLSIGFILLMVVQVNAQGIGFGPQLGYEKVRDADQGNLMGGAALRFKLGPAIGVEGAINYRQQTYENDALTVRSWPIMMTGLIYPIWSGRIRMSGQNTFHQLGNYKGGKTDGRPSNFYINYVSAKRFAERTRVMISKRLILLAAAGFFVACTPGSPPSSILAPEHVTIDLQVMVAKFSGKVVPATPNQRKSPPFMNGAPEHLQFAFDNDHLSGAVRYRERQLLLYPINAYRELFGITSREQAKFNKEIKLLQQLIANSAASFNEAIPVLPPVETIQLFCSQIRYLDFADGAGVRFVTRYAMEASPTTNENIFYTFQGLTSDGRYYISVFYPITAKGLPETEVILTTINFLNRLASTDFTPDLARMDDMIKSLRVVEPVR